jgi:valyl-tRNA synthetase
LPPVSDLDLPSRWIASRMTKLVASVQRLFDSYLFGEAGRQIDDFLWGEFADWYIEISKYPLYQGDERVKTNARRVLVAVLDTCLRLLHPYMPFVTEEIWSFLPHEGEALILAAWAQADASYLDNDAENDMVLLIDLVRAIRNVRDEYNVEPSRKITAQIAPGSHPHLFAEYDYLFARLCNVASIQILSPDSAAPEQSASVIVGDVTTYLPLADFVDVAAECERLTREQEKLQEQIARAQAQLSNQQFISRARPDVVERARTQLASLQASAEQIAERLARLCSG